jgi:hypothetical protein
MKDRKCKLGPLCTLLAATFVTLPILAQSSVALTLADAIRSTLLRHPNCLSRNSR